MLRVKQGINFFDTVGMQPSRKGTGRLQSAKDGL